VHLLRYVANVQLQIGRSALKRAFRSVLHLLGPQLGESGEHYTEGMYPYHIQCIQHLEPVDICSRLELCRYIISNPQTIRNILFTDEAHTS